MAFASTRIEVRSIPAIVQSARTTTNALAPSFPHRSFASSPENHGLTRTGLKAASDGTSFSAVMDAIAFRLHNLSISEKLARQATLAGGSVNIETSTPAEPTAVGDFLGRKLLEHKSKIFAKCTQGITAGFKRTASKRANQTKKTGGRSPSQCASEADPLVRQIAKSMSGRTVLATLEAGQQPQVTRFREMFPCEAPEPAVQWVGDATFPPPTHLGVPHSIALPTAATVGDGTTGVPMDEDIQQRPLPQPTSPAPMEVDTETTSHNDTLPPNPCELDALTPESPDSVMNDGEDVSSKTELPRESASKTRIDSGSANHVSSTPLTEDVDMEVTDSLRSFTSPQQASIPFMRNIGACSTSDSLDGTSKVDVSQGRARTVAQTATAAVAPLEGAPAQPLSTSPLAAAPGVQPPTSEPPTEVAENGETHATQRQVTPIQSGRWGLSKQASQSPLPTAGDEASEEAEAEAFFAKRMAAVGPPVKAKPKQEPLPSPSEPKPTKGSDAMSLMDDLMTGFRGSAKPKSSQQQAPAAARSPTRSNPPATNVPRTSLAIQRTLPLVAGRQPGPQPSPPYHVGTGPEATAPGGSVITPSEAPSTVPTIDKVKGPRMGNPRVGLLSETALPEPTVESSNVAMDGIGSGRRVVKGSRRVARAVAMTGWTWENTQQKALEAQAAQDLENSIEMAPAQTSSLRAFEERARSSAWHAMQPPPPPEAIPYVDVGRQFRRGA
ncbi:hypothetical protein FS837_011241 [Tulasnella sp. UAMH 9824]|nr:hypothetical protein FS837_011241 [Tulasnella sp. UAMH 9824]